MKISIQKGEYCIIRLLENYEIYANIFQRHKKKVHNCVNMILTANQNKINNFNVISSFDIRNRNK